MLEVIVESLDNVPEAFHGEYVERDGKFVLELKGAFSQIDRDALQGSLRKERADHKDTRGKLTAFGEHTPETIETLVTAGEDLQLQLDASGGTDEERLKKIDELAERKSLARIKPIERKLEALNLEFGTVTGERDKLLGEKATNKIIAAVTDPAVLKEAGLVPEAVEDVKLWALANFEIDEHSGKVVSRDTLGTPGLTPKDVYGDMKTNNQRRHWFGPTTGAGAGGGRAGDSFDKNPFAQETFSLTNIGKAVQADPARAVRMAKAATTKDRDALKFLPASIRPKND